MEIAYLSLGSNLGNRIQHFFKARHHISREIGTVVTVSSIYKTAPWGNSDQPDFYNQVIVIQSQLTPQRALEFIHDIEKKMGRDRVEKWGPRTIDIDILFWGSRQLSESNLTIPHPGIPLRKFVLIPLIEVNPEMIHPSLGIPMQFLLKSCADTLAVEKLDSTEDS